MWIRYEGFPTSTSTNSFLWFGLNDTHNVKLFFTLDNRCSEFSQIHTRYFHATNYFFLFDNNNAVSIAINIFIISLSLLSSVLRFGLCVKNLDLTQSFKTLTITIAGSFVYRFNDSFNTKFHCNGVGVYFGVSLSSGHLHQLRLQ